MSFADKGTDELKLERGDSEAAGLGAERDPAGLGAERDPVGSSTEAADGRLEELPEESFSFDGLLEESEGAMESEDELRLEAGATWLGRWRSGRGAFPGERMKPQSLVASRVVHSTGEEVAPYVGGGRLP